jgi:hypothetical protein
MQLHQRFAKCMYSLATSDNVCVKICASLAINGSGSDTCNSLNFICHRYYLFKPIMFKDTVRYLTKKIQQSYSASDEIASRTVLIRDLIDMRESHPRPFLSVDEISTMLDYLCTE